MYTVDSLYNKFITALQGNPHLPSQIESKLNKIYTKIEVASLKELSKKYCMRFMIIESEISGFFNEYNIFDKDEVKHSFLNSWNAPETAIMFSNTFYHNMLLLYYYGIKKNLAEVRKQALHILLYRIWNGRSIGAFKICDTDTMEYVISQMLDSRKYVAAKFETPKILIQDYFYPTITKKYDPIVSSGLEKTKILFTAAYNRIRQIFRFNPYDETEHEDVANGQTRYKSGIQIFYYKAKDENLKISTLKVNNSGDDSEGLSSADYISVNSISEYVDQITNFIIMNSYPQYDAITLEKIKNETASVNMQIIITIMHELHSVTYSERISECLTLFFKRITDVSKLTICSDDFFFTVKNKIISSKHNKDINSLKDIIDNMLIEIFQKKFPKIIYVNFSEQHKIQLKKIVVYFLAVNIQQHLCQN